jgi:hypothetical protein
MQRGAFVMGRHFFQTDALVAMLIGAEQRTKAEFRSG